METPVATTVKIDGVHCEACQKIIERKLSKIEGVSQVEALLSGVVIISADRSISVDEVRLALEGTDYRIN